MALYVATNSQSRPSTSLSLSARTNGKRTKRSPRRGRLVAVAVAAAVLFISAWPHVFSMTLTPGLEQVVHVVAPGETLWDIARTYKNPRTDIREMIDRIRVANDLASATVHPGQVLHVPVGK